MTISFVALALAFIASRALLALAALVEIRVKKPPGRDGPRPAVTKSLAFRTVFLLGGTLGLFPVAMETLLQSTVRKGTHVPRDEAPKRIGRLLVPAGASDVNYCSCWLGANADFAIDEKGFLAWAKEQGWTPEPVGPDEARRSVKMPAGDSRGPESVEISTGYFYDILLHRRGTSFKVAYDRDRGRVYYRYASY